MADLPAIILAAGCGKRMGPEGVLQPKTLFRVGSRAIIDIILDSITAAGCRKCVVVTGHRAGQLSDHLGGISGRVPIEYIENSVYDKTNNIYSLWLAREHLKDGFYLLEADVCFDPQIFRKLAALPHPNAMVVDVFRPPMNGTVVSLGPGGMVEKMFMTTAKDAGFDYAGKFKTVNLYKCGAEYAREYLIAGLDERIQCGDVNSYYESVIKKNIDDGAVFYGLETGTLKWWEIDTPEDLQIAENIFKDKADTI